MAQSTGLGSEQANFNLGKRMRMKSLISDLRASLIMKSSESVRQCVDVWTGLQSALAEQQFTRFGPFSNYVYPTAMFLKYSSCFSNVCTKQNFQRIYTRNVFLFC